jgi:hypothetical protein
MKLFARSILSASAVCNNIPGCGLRQSHGSPKAAPPWKHVIIRSIGSCCKSHVHAIVAPIGEHQLTRILHSRSGANQNGLLTKEVKQDASLTLDGQQLIEFGKAGGGTDLVKALAHFVTGEFSFPGEILERVS